MAIHVERNDDWTLIQLEGPLDCASAGETQGRMLDLLEGTPRSYVIDLEGVHRLDSSGLATLVKFYREVRTRGGRLSLCGVQREPMRVFQMTRLDRIFTIQASSDAAKAA